MLNFHLNQHLGSCEVEKEEDSELLGVEIDFDFIWSTKNEMNPLIPKSPDL